MAEPAVQARLLPGMALGPGHADARALLVAWFLRKATYGLFFLGVIAAVVVERGAEVEMNVSDLGAAWDGLRSPAAGMAGAIVLRVVVSVAGLVMAYPLARRYEDGLAPRTNIGRTLGIWLDRLKVTRAYRSLRWTHHVRQAAVERLPGRWWSRGDPVIDVANIALAIAAVAVLLAVA